MPPAGQQEVTGLRRRGAPPGKGLFVSETLSVADVAPVPAAGFDSRPPSQRFVESSVHVLGLSPRPSACLLVLWVRHSFQRLWAEEESWTAGLSPAAPELPVCDLAGKTGTLCRVPLLLARAEGSPPG